MCVCVCVRILPKCTSYMNESHSFNCYMVLLIKNY